MIHTDAPPLTTSKPAFWHWALLLAGLPLALTLAVPDWMYSPTDYIDAWVYHGFFRHLEMYNSTVFPRTYYGSRLGWIVPGYVAYHLFEPVAAAVTLHLTYYCLAVCSLYAVVRRAAGPSSALFGAIAFGLYLPAIRALGSDYVDGAVIAYALLAVAVGLRGMEPGRPWWMLASGAATGLMLNSSVGAALIVPSIAVWLVPLRPREWLLAVLWLRALLMLAGVVMATAVLSVVSVAMGGDWDFFLYSFRWLGTYWGQNPWDVTGLDWVATSPWVFLPFAALVATILMWLRAPRDRRLEWKTRAVGALTVLWLIFAAWDFIGSGALLYWPFYASWLTPWSFIALAVVMDRAPTTRPAEAVTLTVCAGALAASLAWPHAVRLSSPGFLPFGVTVALVVAAVLVRSGVVSRMVVAGTLVCLHGWITTTNFYAPVTDRADAFRAIDRAVVIMEQYIGATQPRFLLTPPVRLGHYVQGLTSVYLWGYTIVSDRYPALTADQASRILPGAMVIVISEADGAAGGFDEVFAPYGLSGVVKGSNRVETIHGPLYLTFLEATARPVPDASQAEGLQTATPTPARP